MSNIEFTRIGTIEATGERPITDAMTGRELRERLIRIEGMMHSLAALAIELRAALRALPMPPPDSQ
jgi:hypothetical protein